MKKATRQIFEEANNKIKTIFPGLHIADAAKVAPEFKLEKVKTKVEKCTEIAKKTLKYSV